MIQTPPPFPVCPLPHRPDVAGNRAKLAVRKAPEEIIKSLSFTLYSAHQVLMNALMCKHFLKLHTVRL